MFRNTFQAGAISILSARGSHPLQLWDVCLDSSESEGQGLLRRIKQAELGEGSRSEQVGGPTIEISGARLSQNYIVCPPKLKRFAKDRPSLGIALPFFYATVHVPQHSGFSIEVTILDNTQTIRRFRASNYQSDTVVKPDICTFPLELERQDEMQKRDPLLLPSKKRKAESEGDNHHAKRTSYNDGNYYGPNDSDEGSDSDDDGHDSNKTSCWNRICIPLSEYTKRAYGTAYVETMWVQVHANCRLRRVYFAEKQMDEDDELPEEFRLYYPTTRETECCPCSDKGMQRL